MIKILDFIAKNYLDRTDVTAQRVAISRHIRHAVVRRDRTICRYCGVNCQSYYELDHVYPVSLGGETSVNNLVVACRDCNRKKSAKVGIWPMPAGYFHSELTSWRRWLLWLILRS